MMISLQAAMVDCTVGSGQTQRRTMSPETCLYRDDLLTGDTELIMS